MQHGTDKQGIRRLCRVCGNLLKTAGRVSYVAEKSATLLSDTFGIDVTNDNPQSASQETHDGTECSGSN